MVNLIAVLEGKEKKKWHTSNKGHCGMIDYTRFSYCTRCATNKPITMIRCDDCKQLLRHSPLSKKAKYLKEALKYY